MINNEKIQRAYKILTEGETKASAFALASAVLVKLVHLELRDPNCKEPKPINVDIFMNGPGDKRTTYKLTVGEIACENLGGLK